MKRKIVPKVTLESSKTTFKPPYQTIKPTVIDVESSAIGKNIELYQTVLSHAFLCFSLIFTKFSYSIFSLLNSWTIFIPVNLS